MNDDTGQGQVVLDEGVRENDSNLMGDLSHGGDGRPVGPEERGKESFVLADCF